MNTLEAIQTRRSIRKFQKRAIAASLLEELVSAAMCAPSARNKQPWHFIIIDHKELLEAISKFHPHGAMLNEASAAVLICNDLEIEASLEYAIQDCSAAAQNLLLAIHEKDLGGVWLGVYPDENRIINLQKLLKLPKNIHPLVLIALGYKAENPAQKNNFNKKRIHHNHFVKA